MLPTLHTLLVLSPLALATPDTLVREPVIAAIDWKTRGGMATPGRWGISVRDPNGREVWQEGEGLYRPASTIKLITSAYALTHMGPLEGLRTRADGRGTFSPLGGWVGQIRLVLGGDYTLDRAASNHSLNRLAADLAAVGVRRVEGPLIVESIQKSRRADAFFPVEWSTRHRGQSYAPKVGFGLIAGGVPTITVRAPSNSSGRAVATTGTQSLEPLIDMDVRTLAAPKKGRKVPAPRVRAEWNDGRLRVSGAITVGQRHTLSVPGDLDVIWVHLWRNALSEAGISVDPDATPNTNPWMLMAETRSPPLAVLLREINTKSHNLGAEQIWRYVEASAATSRDRWLNSVGWPATHRVLADGSGLSDANLVDPSAFSAWWHRILGSDIGNLLLATLPTGGEGTLRRSPSLGDDKIRAKTGSLGNTTSLVGAWRDAAGQRWTFVLIYEGSKPAQARASMMRLLTSWTNQSSPLLTASFEDSLLGLGGRAAPPVWWTIPQP